MHLSTISTNIQLALRSIDDLDKLKEQRKSFDNLANNMMNKFNNEETLCLVARINVPQEMKLPPGIPGEFYKGYTNFGNDDNDDDLNVNLERLIFTSVFSEPSDFQWP